MKYSAFLDSSPPPLDGFVGVDVTIGLSSPVRRRNTVLLFDWQSVESEQKKLNQFIIQEIFYKKLEAEIPKKKLEILKLLL